MGLRQNSTAYLYDSLKPTSMMAGGEFSLQEPEMLKAAQAASDAAESAGISPESKKAMGQAAAAGMSAGGSLGGILTGAGITGLATGAPLMGMAGGLGAAGLALSFYEQKKQAEAAEENARIQEAQNRKAAVQNAISNALSATKLLGV